MRRHDPKNIYSEKSKNKQRYKRKRSKASKTHIDINKRVVKPQNKHRHK